MGAQTFKTSRLRRPNRWLLERRDTHREVQLTILRASPEGWWLGAATTSQPATIQPLTAIVRRAQVPTCGTGVIQPPLDEPRLWLAERTGTTGSRRRRRAVRHMPYLHHRTHQLALQAHRGSQQERHRLSAGPQRKPSSSFSHGTRTCSGVRTAGISNYKIDIASSIARVSARAPR